MTVREILKSKGNRIVTIAPEATVSDAIARLVQNNIGSLPVVDADGRLVGVYSERDVIRGVHNRGEAHGQAQIREVMTPDPVTCTVDCDVEEVMTKMNERRIAKIPVLDGDRLVGVVSVGDMIKVICERLQSENTHLISYLYGSA